MHPNGKLYGVRCALIRNTNFKITDKMTKKNKTSETTAQCAIQNVTTRTWLFSGWYAGDEFEIEVSAENRETAIAYFETDFTNHKWHMTREVV